MARPGTRRLRPEAGRPERHRHRRDRHHPGRRPWRGTVELRFGPAPASGGRTVAWTWVAAAGAAALLLALAVSWYVARRLSVPLLAVTRAARAFTGGDQAVRARLRAPGELANAVDAMADQVVHAEQVRRQLSADIAHELRTPLAALQAGLEELRDGLAEPDPARLASLHDQSLRLGRVTSLLPDSHPIRTYPGAYTRT